MKLIVKYLTLIGRLRNAEHFDFFENIVEYIRTKTLKPASLVPLWTLLCQLFEKEDEIYKRDIKSVETKQINDLNEKRKVAYMAFKRSVELATYSETEALHNAGVVLTEITDKYADVYSAPMTEISALVFNMIQDLARPRYAAAVATAGLADAVDRLERENEAFKAIYAERTYNLEEIKNKGSMKDIRRQVDEAAAIFTDSVNAFYRTNELMHPGDPEVKAVLEDIITFINSFIHQYETIYARRTPQYTPGKDPVPPHPGEEDGDEPDEEEPAGPPRFMASAQEVLGQGILSHTGSQMSVEMADPAAFAAALYPVAQGGVLRMYHPSENGNFEDFPIADFLTDSVSQAITGLVVDVYSPEDTGFNKPFAGVGNSRAEVLKDDGIIAFIDGMELPATMSEG